MGGFLHPLVVCYPRVMSYEPGIYVKGDRRRQAHTAAQAVALAFDGYRLESTDTAEDSAPAPTVSDTAPVPDVPTPSSLFGQRADEGTDESQEDE